MGYAASTTSTHSIPRATPKDVKHAVRSTRNSVGSVPRKTQRVQVRTDPTKSVNTDLS